MKGARFKPKRGRGKPWCTAEYAAERIKAKFTVPGSSPHQALLAEVAEEVLEAVMRLAGSTGAGAAPGRTVQVDPIKPMLKLPGNLRLKP
jgi:hypothetical protein